MMNIDDIEVGMIVEARDEVDGSVWLSPARILSIHPKGDSFRPDRPYVHVIMPWRNDSGERECWKYLDEIRKVPA